MSETLARTKPAIGQGVRQLTLEDQAPNAEIFINERLYQLEDIVKGKSVIDIGCGYGRNRVIVEGVGGTWTGVEPFEGGAHTVVGSAEDLPFDDEVFDVAIMDAVLEHVPDVGKAFTEVSRVLKQDGLFIGYVAFMECFHEISYSHLSYKALEHYASLNNMQLIKIAGGSRFGIDYHLKVLLYPLPVEWARGIIAFMIRGIFKSKSVLVYLLMRLKRRASHSESARKASLYYQVECLRQSNGFTYMIKKGR
jgi:SAM-dependent methyltransferase